MIKEGKRRFNLLPLNETTKSLICIGENTYNYILLEMNYFTNDFNILHLENALKYFVSMEYGTSIEDYNTAIENAKKYGERNRGKKIPGYCSCYINNAVRHYLKLIKGEDDEPHDKAFIWNVLCCIRTVENERNRKIKQNVLSKIKRRMF